MRPDWNDEGHALLQGACSDLRRVAGDLEQLARSSADLVARGGSRVLTVDDGRFLRGGRTHRILSGSAHYFRIHADHWEDRLAKVRGLGLNTVDTYIPWSLHEPTRGVPSFDGGRDVARFIDLADAAGLDVILRPGPYVCSELDLGGLPWWLLAGEGMRLRTNDAAYLDEVARWFDLVAEIVVPRLATNGGPVVAVQLENEYGYHGTDRDHLTWIRDAWKARGLDVLLFTSDDADAGHLRAGRVQGVLQAANFGSRPQRAAEALREAGSTGPLFCAELWTGWFDHWEQQPHATNSRAFLDDLATMLDDGWSLNLYIAAGGTTPALASGSHGPPEFSQRLFVTDAYEFDAPIDAAGRLTPRYHAIRDVLGRHVQLPEIVAAERTWLEPLAVTASWLGCVLGLDAPGIASVDPVPLEQTGVGYGFALYECRLPPDAGLKLRCEDVRDRAQVYVDRRPVGVLDADTRTLTLPPGRSLQVLVENCGRRSFGADLHDRKGLRGPAFAGPVRLGPWTSRGLGLPDLLRARGGCSDGCLWHPSRFGGTFTVKEAADTTVRVSNGHRGVVFINDMPLGRYAPGGPQDHLFVPGPLLVPGRNRLDLVELHPTSPSITVLLSEEHDQPAQ